MNNMEAITALAQKAHIASKRQDWETVLAAWQEVIRLAPEHGKCFNYAALALRKMGRFDESDAYIQQAIDRFGMKTEYCIFLGDTAMDQRKFEVALAHWATLRAIDPLEPRGYYRAARALLALGRVAEAEEFCQQGLNVQPQDTKLLLHHVETAAAAHNWRAVRTRMARAATLHPTDLDISQMLVDVTLRAEKLGVVMEQDPDDKRPIAPSIPWSKALERHLDMVQAAARATNLQRRIAEGRKAWLTGQELPRHGGIMRHFERAKTDDRLARILAGQTDRDRGRKPGAPIRVVFFLPEVTQTDHLTPLIERMQHDPRFETILLCAQSGGRNQADAFTFFSAKYPASDGWRVLDGGPKGNLMLSFYELDADQVFFHTPYSFIADRPFYLRADFAARHARVGHVTYGYPLLTLDAAEYHVYAGDHVRVCDMFFAESPACLAAYGRHIAKDRLHVTGYTKADEFRRHLEPVSFEELAARPGPLDVMWTPHWHLAGDASSDTHTCNFLAYYEFMLRLAERPDVQLHVRPHPLMRGRLHGTRIMTYDEYDAVLEQFRAKGAKVYPAETGVSYVPALMQTAVLVSDFSSLVAEFTIANRPILFCRTEQVWNNGKWIGPFGKELIENCTYVVDDQAQLEARLDELLRTRQHPMERRQADFVKRNELFPEGSAVEKICDILDKTFNPE